MQRRAFLETLSAPVVAACAVCLGSCGSKNTDTPAATVNFTIDLATQLTSVGATIVNSGVIVLRTATGNGTGSFSAVQVACTHEGTAINWNAAQNRFICPNHGAQFSGTGSVLLGPATKNLKQFNIAVSGNSLMITG
jgi:cytochrome b6-f complex iron-sulfur subunit